MMPFGSLYTLFRRSCSRCFSLLFSCAFSSMKTPSTIDSIEQYRSTASTARHCVNGYRRTSRRHRIIHATSLGRQVGKKGDRPGLWCARKLWHVVISPLSDFVRLSPWHLCAWPFRYVSLSCKKPSVTQMPSTKALTSLSFSCFLAVFACIVGSSALRICVRYWNIKFMSLTTSIVESGVTSGYDICLEREYFLLDPSSMLSLNGKDLIILRSEGQREVKF